MTEQEVVSRHFLRRTARMKRSRVEQKPENVGVMFRVVRATRGPYRWFVVRVKGE